MTRIRRRFLVRSTALALAIFADACLIRTMPLPPPTAERVLSATCAPSMCPDGGVTVTIEGRANPGSLIVAENITHRHNDGRRYSATAWSADMIVPSDAGVDASVVNQSVYTITLSPISDPDGTVTVSQVGDTISLVQFVRNNEGLWQQSSSFEVTVH